MAKTTITRNEELQLIGLATLAQQHSKMLNQCRDAMEAIIGTKPEEYAADDVVWGDRDVAWLLEREKIAVEG